MDDGRLASVVKQDVRKDVSFVPQVRLVVIIAFIIYFLNDCIVGCEGMDMVVSLLLLLWTGQMGFQRQLTSDEIVEQVTRFATHLRSAPPAPLQNEGGGGGRGKQPKQHGKQQRLSNIVFMGEGKMIVIVSHKNDDAWMSTRNDHEFWAKTIHISHLFLSLSSLILFTRRTTG